jgi:hypothetical protein
MFNLTFNFFPRSNKSGLGGESNISAGSNMEAINRALSPLEIIVDIDSDDDTYGASVPVYSTPKEAMVPLRKTVSYSMLDSLEKRKGLTMFSSDPLCWTNMRTRTKRTRGTENPDAFIRLNMRIVRVAHFSFITQVERQLCIVNRGYTIVTKQQ